MMRRRKRWQRTWRDRSFSLTLTVVISTTESSGELQEILEWRFKTLPHFSALSLKNAEKNSVLLTFELQRRLNKQPFVLFG